jgi:hypothetical protein
MTNWLKQFVKRHIIPNGPDELGLCELDCRIDDCKLDDLKQCKNRIAYLEQLSRISGTLAQTTPKVKKDRA